MNYCDRGLEAVALKLCYDVISGAQPEFFQDGGDFIDIGYFNKDFVKMSRKKRPRRKQFWNIFS